MTCPDCQRTDGHDVGCVYPPKEAMTDHGKNRKKLLKEFDFEKDCVHAHFEDVNDWDWCDISMHGVSMLNEHLSLGIEDDSPIQEVISGVAAQANQGAFNAVAAMLGLDSDSLMIIAAQWEENQNDLPPAITFDDLKLKINEWEAECAARRKS